MFALTLISGTGSKLSKSEFPEERPCSLYVSQKILDDSDDQDELGNAGPEKLALHSDLILAALGISNVRRRLDKLVASSQD